ncbi:hypothetical protein EG832_18795, partial [bacterium]|nr:hypothetical protein [bacterium]
SLTYFDDSFFEVLSRSDSEYVLSVASKIQMDFVNHDVFMIDGGFNQVVLRDPDFPGMYSLWYTSPVSFGAGDYGFEENFAWSSLFHEMGHNYVLNSPANYYYGGKIDGNANAIFSESTAQIFQHATAYEVVNNAQSYGLPDWVVYSIIEDSSSSIGGVRSGYERYISSGKQFCSWNDPSTPEDETGDTFLTIAYVFCAHAENDGLGYRAPLKRMMAALQVFDEDLWEQYAQNTDSVEADTFRSTLMVFSLSYGFNMDLRSEFEDLGFPISDSVYTSLMGRMSNLAISQSRITSDTHSKCAYSIYSDRIVWTDERNGNWDIYMYDLSTATEMQITTDTSDQRAPDIYGDIIVWEDYRNGGPDIYMHDLLTGVETRITD